jgi:predicted MPP superfamily phosphohydrolase
LSAVAVGFLNFALGASFACWLFWGFSRAARIDLPPAPMAWVLYGIAAAVTVYGLLNAATLRIKEVTVTLPNLPSAWEGRAVAVVTDIHIGNIRGPHFVRRIVERLRKLEPAAVFIAGDMFDGARVDIADSVEAWRTLRTDAGIFFVTGNHDEFADPAAYLAALRNVGLRVLDNEKVEVEGLQIVGVHDSQTHRPAAYREMLSRVGLDRTRASVLIAHHPAHLEIPQQAGISLQVSGHTHAGQFWPWTHVVRRIYRRFTYGLNRMNGLQVLTSSGAGSWGPPIRVGTHSEIVLLRFGTLARERDN